MSLVASQPEHGEPPRWKWTGDEVIRLGGLGVFPPDQRFELLSGEIIQIMPPGARHAAIVSLIAELLRRAFGNGFHVWEEKPIRLDDYSDPQPDVAVVGGSSSDYLERFPGPVDILLLVEVAETTLAYDRGAKLTAYATAGIREYWMVNLRDNEVEVHRDPAEGRYLTRHIATVGEELSPLAASHSALSVSVLLGQQVL